MDGTVGEDESQIPPPPLAPRPPKGCGRSLDILPSERLEAVESSQAGKWYDLTHNFRR